MATARTSVDATAEVPFNNALAELVRGSGAQLAGSLYAVPPADRLAAARLLAGHSDWIHADVFADPAHGVPVSLITELADAGVGPIDVHLLTRGSLDFLPDVCRPGIARITLPFDGDLDVAESAARVRGIGASPWLAIAPETALADCAGALAYVDGVLVMLIEPGTKQTADLVNLTKVAGLQGRASSGVDGNVAEANLGQVLHTGARYVVVGRRLFATSGPSSAREA